MMSRNNKFNTIAKTAGASQQAPTKPASHQLSQCQQSGWQKSEQRGDSAKGGWQQEDSSKGGQDGGWQHVKPQGGRQQGRQQDGSQAQRSLQGGYQQRGPTVGQQQDQQGGGDRQRGPQGSQQSRYQERESQGDRQGGYQQREPQGTQQGSWKERGSQGDRQGSYQQSRPQATQQGVVDQQRGPQGTQKGGYQQRGPTGAQHEENEPRYQYGEGKQQRGSQGTQQGGWQVGSYQQSRPQATQQGGVDQQRGPQGTQKGGYQQRGPTGAQHEENDQQRGLQGSEQGGRQERGSQGDRQGGYQQSRQQGTKQGGVDQQRGPQGTQKGGYQQRGPTGAQHEENEPRYQHGEGKQQRGWQGTQQGGWQERGSQGDRQGGYQQRGPQGTQQGGGDQQRGPQGTQQGGGVQKRGPQGTQQDAYQQREPTGVLHGENQQRDQQGGGDPQRGSQDTQEGGYQERGSQGDRQGGYQQRGPQGTQQGGFQQRDPQQGGYQQRGPQDAQRSQAGALAPKLPQVGPIKRGTLGRPGNVGVNYLTVDLTKMPERAFHYDVTITPERPKKFYRKAFEIFCVQHLKYVQAAFDGRKSCYSVDKLPCTSGDVEVLDVFGRKIQYKIVIKETDHFIVELSSLHSYMKDKIYDKPMRALQCLEVVLAAPCHQHSIRAGRSYFKASGNRERRDLGDGYEALVGLYQSFVLGDKPFFNVDVSHKSFPISMPVIEYLERFGGVPKLNEGSRLGCYAKRIHSYLKGINVIYEPPQSFGASPRSFKVNGFTQNSANAQKFEIQDTLMTVQAYFSSRNYKLKYPNLECLHVGPSVKNIYLPMELCRIEGGQVLNRKDGSVQVAEMIKFSATTTNERKAKIVDLLKYFQHNLNPIVSRFGINIGSDFITVTTRCLAPPQLEYDRNKFAMPTNGSWRMDRNQFLIVKSKANKWAVLFPEAGGMITGKVNEFAQMVLQNAKMVNINMQPEADIRRYRDDCDLNSHFQDLKRKQYDLAFVVIPNRGTTYDYIKQSAELKHGILTQCIKQNNVDRRLNQQLVSNIMLKVNSKLNGINHKLKDDTRTAVSNVMFLGADVTHPSPDQREIPSVVGTAASHDKYGGSYNMQYRLQRAGTGGAREEIDDMESIVHEHLRVYKMQRNRYPDHIIYYRDGVSDGQFLKIKNLELRGISAACAKLKIQPKMCCVIVVKRHHTRFFPHGSPNIKNKFNNVEPGTVVDRTIVHPNEVQFFMVSHQSIQGTAKPTRYNVIENSGQLDIDLLQQMTYNLCHMFPRCNRSVSYPAPAYLAHLAAARGRVYISDSNRRGCRSPREEYERHLINPAFMNSNPMYFV